MIDWENLVIVPEDGHERIFGIAEEDVEWIVHHAETGLGDISSGGHGAPVGEMFDEWFDEPVIDGFLIEEIADKDKGDDGYKKDDKESGPSWISFIMEDRIEDEHEEIGSCQQQEWRLRENQQAQEVIDGTQDEGKDVFFFEEFSKGIDGAYHQEETICVSMIDE